MIDPKSSESVSDYSGFDFARRWNGRGKVTEVERAILSGALRAGDRRRYLEVGSGFGRLSATIAAQCEELVMTDFDVMALARPALKMKSPAPRRVAANLYHLPFVDGTFTGASMIRVYHHLDAPDLAMTELSRVLRPGSLLIVSYNPKPSVGTLVSDVRRALASSSSTSPGSVTFSRGVSRIAPDPFPVRVASRRDFARTAASAGFDTELEFATGLEEFSGLRRLPASWFVHFAETFGNAPGLPTRFAVLRKRTGPAPPWVAPDRLWACPKCARALPDPEHAEVVRCAGCDFSGTHYDGVLDLRYRPPGAALWEVGA